MGFIRLFVLSLGLFIVHLKNIEALTNEEKQEILIFLLPHVAECSKDNSIADGAIQTVLETGNFDTLDACFVACVAKRTELFNAKGLLDKTKTVDLSNQFLSSEDRKSIPDLLKSCEGINDKAVSDGDKGCDRIQHLLECAGPFLSTIFN